MIPVNSQDYITTKVTHVWTKLEVLDCAWNATILFLEFFIQMHSESPCARHDLMRGMATG